MGGGVIDEFSISCSDFKILAPPPICEDFEKSIPLIIATPYPQFSLK